MPAEVFNPDLKAAVAAHQRRFPSIAVGTTADRTPFNIPSSGLWIPARSLDQQVAGFVADIDTVKPGGVIKVFEAEADPEFWNHPEVMEAMYRAAKPEEALVRHYNRGTEMLNRMRMDDAAYDYAYCEKLADKLKITPQFLAELADTDRRMALVDLLGNTFNNFGFVLMQSGKPEKAIPILQRALQFNPSQVFANNNLGDCYRSVGSLELAREYYAQELRVNPVHPTAQASLSTV